MQGTCPECGAALVQQGSSYVCTGCDVRLEKQKKTLPVVVAACAIAILEASEKALTTAELARQIHEAGGEEILPLLRESTRRAGGQLKSITEALREAGRRGLLTNVEKIPPQPTRWTMKAGSSR